MEWVFCYLLTLLMYVPAASLPLGTTSFLGSPIVLRKSSRDDIIWVSASRYTSRKTPKHTWSHYRPAFECPRHDVAMRDAINSIAKYSSFNSIGSNTTHCSVCQKNCLCHDPCLSANCLLFPCSKLGISSRRVLSPIQRLLRHCPNIQKTLN